MLLDDLIEGFMEKGRAIRKEDGKKFCQAEFLTVFNLMSENSSYYYLNTHEEWKLSVFIKGTHARDVHRLF